MSLKFAQINEKFPDTCVIIDALNLAFRDKHAGSEKFAEDYLLRIESFAKSYKAGKLIVAADWGTSTYRLNIWPEYKLTRKQGFEDQTEEEKEAFKRFFKEFERALELVATKYPVLRYKGVEADDIAAYIVRNRKRFGIKTIWLISSDKDWNLLLSEDVSQFSYVTRKEITLNNLYEHRGVATPDEYLSMKVLMGESGASSDNVPGIEQIGPKRAIALIEEYGSAWDLYESLPIPGKYKHIQNLNASGDLIEKNYKLFDLLTHCDEAIGQENIEDIHTRIKNGFQS